MSDFTPFSPDASDPNGDDSTETQHSHGIILFTESQSGGEIEEEEVISEDSNSNEEEKYCPTPRPKTT
jgi:hypothetical protein